MVTRLLRVIRLDVAGEPGSAEVLDRDPWHRSGKASQGVFYGVALSGIGAWVSLDVGSKLLNVAGCGIGLEGVTFTAKP